MHTIKRYANRKLYDTLSKKYITLDKIAKLIEAGEEVSVLDNTTGEDITDATISQILARTQKGQTDHGASSVMIQLLRKGPGTLVDYGKKYVSMWDRALTMADEEIERLVEKLVKDREITPSEGNKLKKEMLNRAEGLKKWIAEKIDRRVKEALDLMNLASREQVLRLTGKIDTLTRKIQRLEKKLAEKADGRAAPKEADTLEEESRTKTIPIPKDDLKPVNPAATRGAQSPETGETPGLPA